MSDATPSTLTMEKPPKSSQTPWRYFYLVLAISDVAAIFCLLIFNHQIVTGFQSVNLGHQRALERQSVYAEINAAAGHSYEVTLDAVQTKRTTHAQEQLKQSLVSAREQLDIARLDAQSKLEGEQRISVTRRLNKIGDGLHAIERDSEQVILHVERDLFAAAQEAMDRVTARHHEIEDETHELISQSRAVMADSLTDAEAESQSLRGRQVFFACGGMLMVGCVTFYGHRMARTLQQSVETAQQQNNSLAEKEARLRTIFDKAADGIVTMNDQGVIESCNQATLNLFCQPREAIVGNPIYLLMEPYDEAAEANGHLSLYLLDVKSLIGTTRELRGMRPDGSRFYAEVAVAEVRFGERRVITGILHDVTDRRRIEAELKQARLDAEAATEAKSQFLANMSHEIRTPMTAIIGYADLLLEPGQSDDERFRCVDTVRRNADHLLTLINDILDISKIEAGKMTVEKILFSPCQIVGDVASLMRVRAIEKQIGFEVHYDGPIPENITGDPVRVRQVLINLVGNSIKFTKQGKVTIHAWAEKLGTAESMMCFKVIDSGIGMTEEQIGRLFRPFTQADYSTTRQFGGTGLGLTICRRLVEMMGGAVHVGSVYGLGSSFEFRVPTGNLESVRLLETVAEAEAVRHPADKGQALTNARLTARVLLAEDGMDNYRLISHHLRKAGATVVHAENGQLAVDKALAAISINEPFDVVLMDMQMPVMDGYQATAKLRSTGYRAPILALTAHAMSGDRQKCINAGCDDFLTKPIDAALLISTVQKYATGPQRRSPPPREVKATDAQVSIEALFARRIPTPQAETSQIEKPQVEKPQVERQASATFVAKTEFIDLTCDEEPLVSEFADDADMLEIIDMFIDGLDERIQELDAAHSTGAVSQLGSVAHRLKGAAGGYGYPRISDVAMELDKHCKDKKPTSEATDLVNQLILLCRRAIAGRKSAAPAANAPACAPTQPMLSPGSNGRPQTVQQQPFNALDPIATRIHGLVSSEPDLKAVGEILSDLAATLPQTPGDTLPVANMTADTLACATT